MTRVLKAEYIDKQQGSAERVVEDKVHNDEMM